LEIELPDGTILEAPDDADVKKVVQGYQRQQTADPKLATHTERVPIRGVGMTDVEVPDNELYTLGAGVKSGVTRGLKGAGNLLVKALNFTPAGRAHKIATGKDLVFPKGMISDEELRAQDKRDAPLSKTGAGFIGQMGGQVLSTAPLALATGGTSIVSTAAPTLTRTLATRLAPVAVEGAVGGAMFADPDEQGEGAAKGATLGLALNRAGAGAGRLTRGLVKRSQAADDLSLMASQHGDEIELPLSQAASDKDAVSRIAKTAYQEALPLIPGVKGRLERQATEAADKFREIALKEATPDGTMLPKDPGKNVGESVRAIREGFTKSYDDTVRSLDYTVPKDFEQQITSRINQNLPEIDNVSREKAVDLANSLMKRFSSGKPRIEGSNLMLVRSELIAKAKKAPSHEKGAIQAAQEVVDDMISSRLSVQGLLKQYENLSEPYRNFVAVSKASKSAKAQGGNFSPAQLARAAKDPSSQLHLAQTATEAMSEPATRSSLAGRILAGVGIGGYGAFIDPLSAAGVWAGGNLLANRSTQRALMGQTALQKRIVEMLRRNPETARLIGAAGRSAAVTEATDEN
jgi:hypothetical protein